ncbi:AAWKG family protein [Streptomyces shenzhenensis]|uniref:AAWKG family protein n=1 Tax=Streptomyces shenzhenensis TaxID=943815 RepID=UPI00381A8DA6
MADESDHWARAVESFTGYKMPSRHGMFDDVKGLEPNGNAPLISVAIEDREFMEMTDSAYQLYSGPNVDGHDFVIHFFLPGEENPDNVDVSKYSEDELKKKIYPKLRKVVIDFVGPNGSDVKLSYLNPFSWSESDSGSSLVGMNHPMGQFVQGAGSALYQLGYRGITTHNNIDFSSNGVTVDASRAMDFESFTRTAQAYDRVAKFFMDHAETLKQWKESLGKDTAAWKGKAAEVFADLIGGLHKNYSGFADQMHPAKFSTDHESMWDYYASSSLQGDAILGAGNAVFAAIRDLYQAWTDWETGTNVDWVSLSQGEDPVEFLPGLGSPYGILYSMLESVQTWAYNHNARFAVQGTKSGSTMTYYSGNYTGAGTWRETKTTTHFYVLRPEAEQVIPGLGYLNDVSTWAGLGTKAVESWNKGVEEHLAPTADKALSSVNNAFIKARRVIDEVLSPEVTNFFSGSGGSGGSGSGKDSAQDAIDKANKAAQDAIDKANKAAQDAIDKAEAAAEKARAEAEAAIKKANDQAEKAIKDANAKADEAVDKANDAAEKARADAEAAAEEANNQAKSAIEEANNQAERSNADAKTAIDEANSEAEKAIQDARNEAGNAADKANSDARTAIDAANNQAQSVIDGANDQLRNGNNQSGVPLGPTSSFVTSGPPGDRSSDGSRARTGGISVQNPDGSETTTYPDGTEVTTGPDGTVTETGPDGTVTVTKPDGSVTVTAPDGSVHTAGPSGEITTSPGGTTTISGPSGEITTRPDGSTSVDGPSGRTTTSSDGTVTVTGPDGSTVVTSPDGSTTVTGPDGSKTVTSPDGSRTVTLPDGSVQVRDPSGRITTTLPDGSTTVTSPDGSKTVTSPDGSTRVTLPDGSVQVTDPGGRVTATHPDGSTSVTSPDGSTTVTGPDGSKTVTSPDGSKTVTSPDGSTTVTSPDGSTRVTLPDGSVQVTDPGGRITTTYPDGSTSVTAPDGTTTVTSPDGSITVTAPDGSTTHTGPDGSTIGDPNHANNGSDGGSHIDTRYPSGSPGGVTVDSPHSSSGGGSQGSGSDTGSDGYAYDDAAATSQSGSSTAYNGAGSGNPFVQGDQSGAGSGALGGGGAGGGGGSPMMPPMGGMRGGGESPSERERSSPGPRVSRTSMRRGSASAQANRRAAATPDEEVEEDVVTTRSGAPFVPAMPPPAQRGQATQSGDRERTAWVAEDEDVWGTDEGTTPAVIGR